MQNTNFHKWFYGYRVPLHLQDELRVNVSNPDFCDDCMVSTECSKCIVHADYETKEKYKKVGM